MINQFKEKLFDVFYEFPKVNGYTSVFFPCILTKGNNFCDILFAFLDDKTFPEGVFFLTFKAPYKNCSRQRFNFLLSSYEENKA